MEAAGCSSKTGLKYPTHRFLCFLINYDKCPPKRDYIQKKMSIIGEKIEDDKAFVEKRFSQNKFSCTNNKIKN